MINKEQLQRFGIDFSRAGAHSSRTLMLEELEMLLTKLENPTAQKIDYLKAIDDENCLSKRTQSNRKLTYRDLVKLYTLDPNVPIFRTFIYFWQRDKNGRPLLALLCSYNRDSLLRLTTPFILKLPEGSLVNRDELEDFIEQQQPGRLSPGTLRSTARNINSSWTQSGHLMGRAKKRRAHANPSPGSVAYALFLGYLMGNRGESLFTSEFVKLLDCSIDQAIELAEEASRRGWINFKRVGKTMEVVFPNLLSQQELEWLREQN
jgi:hypothetical protein